LFTGDLATPAELTVTFLHPFHSCRVVATPTTHDVTAIGSRRRLATLSASCTQRP